MGASVTLPKPPAAVQAVYDAYPTPARDQLLKLRTLVYDTAAGLSETGPITETLKWGEPSYLNKAGTTIRLAWSAKRPDVIGLFVNCQTTLLDEWREHYSGTLDLIGNREVRMAVDAPLPLEPLRHCIAMALTYKWRKGGA
ncbi:DUF1801 domain-containing protein [Henriciella litoralis]|uniref:DUF1801 domain-containing protein n=1 Tax=Henriciella litoralis TaxID=568102 RepID=UPI0009FF4671|nr:DUF1801 domain-containing protein [Henriciella litoralis]